MEAKSLFWKRWLSAALILLGINVYTSGAYAQKRPLKHRHHLDKKVKRSVTEVVPIGLTGVVFDPPLDTLKKKQPGY